MQFFRARVVLLRNLDTPLGQLERLLMILEDAVQRADRTTAYDVLWGIESHSQYQKGIEEMAAARREGKEKEKDKASKPVAKAAPKRKSADEDPPTAAEVLKKYKESLKTAAVWRNSEDKIGRAHV